ncbi:EpsG family protein [Bacteroides fragilis]|uniref:EpsG family protein n=1 Tax=Bacteroides fragilis TaxID=817 RepID=UPI00202DEC2E|nr:EpsG family protein [Bacteroides fragilis]MCM0219381.1 EpsG family protein [Bacteroides fragilis]MCM0268343.1 EpsG family protein [Bacteroides fragilis]
MNHYILLASFLLIVPICSRLLSETNKQKVCEKTGYWLCVTLLMFLGSFRAESIGNDTHEYLRIFQEIAQDVTIETRYEIGYIYLNYIVSLFNSNPQSILIVTSVITLFSFGRFIWKYSQSPWLSLFLFFTYGFFVFSITAVRQSLAIAVLLFSYDYILQGKKLKFVLTVLIATTFHTTAIFFLVSYLCRMFKPTLRTIILFLGIGIVCSYLFSTLLGFAFQLFTIYEGYDQGIYFGETRLASILYVVISLLILFFCYFILRQKKVIHQLSDWQLRNNSNMLILVLFAVVFYIISLELNLLDRIAIYYNVFSLILLPNAIYRLYREKRMIVTSLVIILFFGYSAVIMILRPEWGTIYPYSFCW